MILNNYQVNSLAEVVRLNAQKNSNKIAFTYLRDGEKEMVSITFGELDEKARAFASRLQQLTNPNERAILLYPSSLEFIIAFLGCMYANIISAPTTIPHLKRSTPRLKLMMEDAKAKIACTTSSVYEKIKQVMGETVEFQNTQWVISESISIEEANNWKEIPTDKNDIAFLQYTSGSTSSPKGVMISNHNLLKTIEDICIGAEVNEKSVFVSWLPIFHDMGLIFGLLSPLYAGGTCYFMPPVSFLEKPLRWLQTISDFSATHTAAPNFAYDVCIKKITEEEKKTLNLSSLKFTLNAAEPVRYETLINFKNAFEICKFNFNSFAPSYGLAEASVKVSAPKLDTPPTICTIDAEQLENNKLVILSNDDTKGYKNVGCGWSHIDADIQIVNPNTSSLCAKDEIGEIWVKSESVALGYWQNPEATKKTFQAKILGHSDGFYLRTGDMGFIYNGELFIAGRIKDMIIVQGRNFYPQDIELTVEKSHSAVRPSCTAAFEIRDEVSERLIIVQEVKREFRKLEDFTEVANSIRMAVAKNHGLRVHAIALIMPNTIEKTTSGKIQRSASKESFLNKTLEILYEWHAPNTK